MPLATIKILVDVEPAHVLGKRNSTRARFGVLSCVADSKAEALSTLEQDAYAKLRFDPVYRGGERTGRIYAMTCSGQAGMGGGVVIYSWSIAILDPRKGKYPGGGGMSFASSTYGEAERRLNEYVASCEGAA